MNRTEPKMKKDRIVNRTELTAPRCTAFSVNRFTSTVKAVILVTLKVPIATKVVCLSRLLKCLRNLYGKQCGPSSGSTQFASILNSSVMFGNYLQQRTFSDFLGGLRVKMLVDQNLISSCKEYRFVRDSFTKIMGLNPY